MLFPPGPAEKGGDRAAWWAPGAQPRSTHHKRTPFKPN